MKLQFVLLTMRRKGSTCTGVFISFQVLKHEGFNPRSVSRSIHHESSFLSKGYAFSTRGCLLLDVQMDGSANQRLEPAEEMIRQERRLHAADCFSLLHGSMTMMAGWMPLRRRGHVSFIQKRRSKRISLRRLSTPRLAKSRGAVAIVRQRALEVAVGLPC